MKCVTPLFLFVLLRWWGVTEAIPTLLMTNVEDPATIPYRWVSRLLMVGLLVAGAGLAAPSLEAARRSRAGHPDSTGLERRRSLPMTASPPSSSPWFSMLSVICLRGYCVTGFWATTVRSPATSSGSRLA